MPTVPNGTTEIIPTRNYNAGTFSTQPWDLQVGQSQITIMADRNGWPDTGADVISLRFDISFGGGPVQVLAGFTARGGDLINPWTGQLLAQSSFSTNIPQPENPNRQITATATIFSRINTAASMTVT
jgi:hypothetical protein